MSTKGINFKIPQRLNSINTSTHILTANSYYSGKNIIGVKMKYNNVGMLPAVNRPILSSNIHNHMPAFPVVVNEKGRSR